MNNFHPIVNGEDIAATDANGDSARYSALLFVYSCREHSVSPLLMYSEYSYSRSGYF